MHKNATKCNETLSKWCKTSMEHQKLWIHWRRITCPLQHSSIIILGYYLSITTNASLIRRPNFFTISCNITKVEIPPCHASLVGYCRSIILPTCSAPWGSKGILSSSRLRWRSLPHRWWSSLSSRRLRWRSLPHRWWCRCNS
jgi:hypothetical protein